MQGTGILEEQLHLCQKGGPTSSKSHEAVAEAYRRGDSISPYCVFNFLHTSVTLSLVCIGENHSVLSFEFVKCNYKWTL